MKNLSLGKLIKEARINAGLTQSQLANSCQLDIRTIQRIESAKVFPRLYTLKLINESLGTNFKIVLDEIEKKNPKIEKFNWKKQVFSTQYDIGSKNKIMGSLYNNTFTQSGTGIINGNNYSFKMLGIFSPYTLIFNKQGDQIGLIEYNSWMTKAKITICSDEYSWRYDNLWNTKWSIANSDGILLKYKASLIKGSIESKVNDDLLLLCGLFITNYFLQLTIVILILALFNIWSLFLR